MMFGQGDFLAHRVFGKGWDLNGCGERLRSLHVFGGFYRFRAILLLAWRRAVGRFGRIPKKRKRNGAR